MLFGCHSSAKGSPWAKRKSNSHNILVEPDIVVGYVPIEITALSTVKLLAVK